MSERWKGIPLSEWKLLLLLDCTVYRRAMKHIYDLMRVDPNVVDGVITCKSW